MDERPSVSLIGMPAAGKSTIGVLLAKQLARPFVDVDVYIQAGTGRRLQEIIDADGLEVFCQIESEYVCCLDLAGHVVATGGSVVYSDDAMEHLAAHGPVVYLALSLETIQQRLTDLNTRGVVMPAGQTLADVYARRRPMYERWADVTVDCEGLNHQAVVDAIRDAVG